MDNSNISVISKWDIYFELSTMNRFMFFFVCLSDLGMYLIEKDYYSVIFILGAYYCVLCF